MFERARNCELNPLMETTNRLELARTVRPRQTVRCRFVTGAPRNFL
jgi:hypothetical protein